MEEIQYNSSNEHRYPDNTEEDRTAHSQATARNHVLSRCPAIFYVTLTFTSAFSVAFSFSHIFLLSQQIEEQNEVCKIDLNWVNNW